MYAELYFGVQCLTVSTKSGEKRLDRRIES